MTIATTPPIAFSSTDLDEAYRNWGANCGPAALAVALGYTLDQVYPLLPNFKSRGYVSIGDMRSAIDSLRGFSWSNSIDLPSNGVARLEWGGPWPPRARSCYSHWVTTKRWEGACWVFDVNAGWQTMPEWEKYTVPRIVESVKRADGTFRWTHRFEIRSV
jgi:hypothetical protein